MKVYLSRIFILILFLPFTAFANLSDCEDYDGGSNYIQCTYTTGLNKKKFTDGRYLKIEIDHNNQGMTNVFCANNSFTMIIDPSDAEKALGDIHLNISICPDKTGTNCQLIKNNIINVTKRNDTYFAEPKLIEIPLATYAYQYASCDPSANRIMKKKMK